MNGGVSFFLEGGRGGVEGGGPGPVGGLMVLSLL